MTSPGCGMSLRRECGRRKQPVSGKFYRVVGRKKRDGEALPDGADTGAGGPQQGRKVMLSFKVSQGGLPEYPAAFGRFCVCSMPIWFQAGKRPFNPLETAGKTCSRAWRFLDPGKHDRAIAGQDGLIRCFFRCPRCREQGAPVPYGLRKANEEGPIPFPCAPEDSSGTKAGRLPLPRRCSVQAALYVLCGGF